MKNTGKFIAMFLAAALLLCGCGSNMKNYGTTVAATYGDKAIYMDEANFWLRLNEAGYSYTAYMYYYYYGIADFWGMESGRRTQTVAQSLKEDVMAEFLQLNILLDHADELGVTLTAEDYVKIDNAIEDMQENYSTSLFSENVIGSYSLDALKESMKDRALASKVWHAVREQATTNVTDEECRSFTFNYFQVLSTSSGTPKSTGDGEDTVLAGLELAEFLEKELKGGKAFADLKSDFSSVTASTLSYRISDTVNSERFLFKTAKELKDGEIVLKEDDGIWYVVQCVSANDAEAAAEAREELESAQKEDHFKEVYAEWKKSAKEFSVKSAYNSLKVPQN